MKEHNFLFIFRRFFVDFSREIVEKGFKINKKGSKRLKKSSSTSFHVLQAHRRKLKVISTASDQNQTIFDFIL